MNKATELNINYSAEYLLECLNRHRLNPQIVFSKLGINKAALQELESKYHHNASLSDLCLITKNWPSNVTTASFTSHLNQLIFQSINAFHHHAEINQILNLLHCFTLNRFFIFSQSTQFHLFLYDLFIDSLNQYHTVNFNSAVNYDENSQLPHSHLLEAQLNSILDASNIKQKIALLSLQFQIESSAFLLPKSTSQELNKQLAEVLQKNIGLKNQLFFNGDYKFELLVPDIINVTQINLLIAKIFRAFEELVFINSQSILVRPYIGYSYLDTDQLSVNQLFQQSKSALEYAISSQKPYCIYSEDIEKIRQEQIILETEILDAFDHNGLTLSLQPIVSLRAKKCVGAELLLRGSNQSGKTFPPNTIIEVLNNAGKGKIFTRWLINTACRYAHELKAIHQLNLYLAVNLRAEDLDDVELPALFSNALSLWHLDPTSMILEINEKGILQENEQSSAVFKALSILGFKFALDDFGTGLSSLARLRSLPIDMIKIDQSFVKDLSNSQADYEIVQSIATLGKSLAKEVIAEGVEDIACLNVLKKLGVDKCQGYFYSKALPYETFIAWVKTY